MDNVWTHAMAKDLKPLHTFQKTAVELIQKYDFLMVLILIGNTQEAEATTSATEPRRLNSPMSKSTRAWSIYTFGKSNLKWFGCSIKDDSRDYELSTAVGVGAKSAQIDWNAASPYLTNMFAMTQGLPWCVELRLVTQQPGMLQSVVGGGMGADVFINQMIEYKVF